MLKKCPKIASKKVTQAMQGHAGREGGGPYNQPIQSFQGPTCALNTPLGHQRPGGGLLHNAPHGGSTTLKPYTFNFKLSILKP